MIRSTGSNIGIPHVMTGDVYCHIKLFIIHIEDNIFGLFKLYR